MNWKDYEVGKRVVCMEPFQLLSGDAEAGLRLPEKGRVYTIRATRIGQYGLLYLRFQEIVNPPTRDEIGIAEVAFGAPAFRPVDEGRIDQFRQLLKPKPVGSKVPELC